MSQCGCQLAHGADPGDMQELSLKLVEPLFGALPLGDVADEPGEEPPPTYVSLPDRELERKRAAITSLADDNSSNSDDALLAGGPVAGEIPVMFFVVGRGHQQFDVLARSEERRVGKEC